MHINAAQRIMIISVDPHFVPPATTALEQLGYQVINAFSGINAFWHMERSGFPDLAIVDVDETRSLSGLAFYAKVRELSDFPLLLLTGADNLDAVLLTIQPQTDDLLHKPVTIKALVARTQWLLKRCGQNLQKSSQEHEISGALKANFLFRQVTNGKQTLQLSPQESKILYILNQNAGRTVSTQFLRNRIWPDESVDESRVRASVMRLRRKLDEQFGCAVLITTERGRGYRLDPDYQHGTPNANAPYHNGQKQPTM